jgi:glycerol-3-phosphate dehydrogenase subunit C
MKPERRQRQREVAQKILESLSPGIDSPKSLTPESLKERVKHIRQNARENNDALVHELLATLERFPNLKIYLARSAEDALQTITDLAGEDRRVITNNSSVVTQELRPDLIRAGFKVENAYTQEHHLVERIFKDYWDLPSLEDQGFYPAFEIAERYAGLPEGERVRGLALLGVNAVSAADGATFFMEHFTNIGYAIGNVSKVVLVVGLDKIVETREQAFLQTMAMGVFGFESILLALKGQEDPKPAEGESIHSVNGRERELHLLLLDNGRRDLLAGPYSDLFLCIGCRACNKHCPIRHAFADAEPLWTPVNYLKKAIAPERVGVDAFDCLHCEACAIECPVGIDLPTLIWRAGVEQTVKTGVSISRRLLGRPELLARTGTTTAPVSNWLMATSLVRIPMEAVIGIDRRASLPRFHARTLRHRLRGRMESSDGMGSPGCVASRLNRKSKTNGTDRPPQERRQESNLQVEEARILEKKVAYFHGCFANYYDPHLGEATLDVLHMNAVEVAIPDQACCGLPMMGKGADHRVNRIMKANAASLAEWISQGFTVVSTCASCGFFLKHHYPMLLRSKEARKVSENVIHVTDYLLRLHWLGELATEFVPMNEQVFYHTPCHLRALQAEQGAASFARDLLQLIPGVAIAEVSEECCGMAGSYGFQKSHYALSQDIAGRLIGRIVEASVDRIVDDCGACGLQIKACTGRRPDHPMILLHEAYGLGAL